MNLDQDFFHVSQFIEDPKKRSSPEIEHFFPPIQVQTCAQMHTRVKLLEGMQMKTILKLLGGIQSNYWGEIYPLQVSAPLALGAQILLIESLDAQILLKLSAQILPNK